MYAEVLVEYGVKSLDKTFTYIIPTNLREKLKIGMKVVVPFGNTIINGFVVNIKDYEPLENLKEIKSITNEDLILNEELLSLGLYIKETTLCSLISAYQAMLPSSMKIKTIKSNYTLYNNYLVIENIDEVKKHLELDKKLSKKNELLNRLLNKEVILKNEYRKDIIDKLLSLNLIKVKQEIKYRINNNDFISNNFSLTEDQNKAYEFISSKFNSSSTNLLYGVTGSGKTEVYIQLIENVIKNGKTAIMLVPEISLTTQIVQRFYERFGSDVAIMHSALSEGEKYDEYHKIMNNKIKVVVGTRSAIFVPLNRIGIIIIDEEHSPNYKQDNNPRYNAKDVAIKRSEYHQCPVVLGSATPTLETMARGMKGVYNLIELNKRIGKSQLPKITLVDMTHELKKRNTIISDLLNELIIDRLNSHEQIMILLNRRGYSTVVSCKNCGYTFKCPNCEITLTYHKTSEDLRCHYCGYTLKNIVKCKSCNEISLTTYGIGTEKLESELNIKYPDAKVIRMDADTTTKKGSHAKIIKEIESGNADIIIGTQMISKGFDFPKVTLVGVINADDSLNIPDFRSGERTFALLTQVSGRSGRSTLPGEVVIQTYNPDDKILNYVQKHDYQNFFNYEMGNRKLLKYPPYYFLTNLKIASKDYSLCLEEAKKISSYLNNKLNEVIILGPTTASMFKHNNIYRFQIILKYKNFNLIKEHLKYLDEIYASNKKVNLELDINPTQL